LRAAWVVAATERERRRNRRGLPQGRQQSDWCRVAMLCRRLNLSALGLRGSSG